MKRMDKRWTIWLGALTLSAALLGSGAAVVVFVVLYIAAYLATAKAYYRIVSG